METALKNEINATERFNPVFSSHIGEISTSPDRKTILCKVHSCYLPITDFINLLGIVTEITRQTGTEKFIFDKRSLRALKQQCLEWFYEVWKREMVSLGLKKYRIVLPEEDWLKKSVKNAALLLHDELLDKESDYKFCSSLDEAITL